MKWRPTLTFDLQIDVVLVDTEAVSGHACVSATVVILSYVDLQSPIVVQDVRVSVEGTGPAVFEPEAKRHPPRELSKRHTTLSSAKGSLTHQVILGMGDAKESQSSKAR